MIPDASGSPPAIRFERRGNFDLRFPPLPKTVAEISLLLFEQQGLPDVTRLAGVINADPVVASAVLRRVNSAYYGLRRRIDSIERAVFLLGFLEASNLALTAGMIELRDIVQSEEQKAIASEVIKLSVGVAPLSQFLASELNMQGESTAFTTGLLHAVGRLALLYSSPDDYEALWYTSEEGQMPSAEMERSIFGIDHAELAGLVLEGWQLPETVVDVVRHYETPQRLAADDLRLLALNLSGSVSTTELLLRSKAAPTEQELPTTPPLAALARGAGVSATDLKRRIVAQYETIQEFVATMVY